MAVIYIDLRQDGERGERGARVERKGSSFKRFLYLRHFDEISRRGKRLSDRTRPRNRQGEREEEALDFRFLASSSFFGGKKRSSEAIYQRRKAERKDQEEERHPSIKGGETRERKTMPQIFKSMLKSELHRELHIRLPPSRIQGRG